MAFRDADSDRIVTRVVYDGLALAGKTTNLQRLCNFFTTLRRSELHTPEEDEGRTCFFDFLRLDGGFIAGRPLSCHLVTVPGQTGYAQRRQFLLGEADAVVLVCDSTPDGLDQARRRLEATRRYFERERPDWPLRLVVQANKQDLPGALDVETVRSRLELDASVQVIPAQAMEGQGVRETAVLGIRAAVDGVQELVSLHGLGCLPVCRETPEELHNRMLEEERQAVLAGSVLELSGPSTVDADGLPEWDELPAARAQAPARSVPRGLFSDGTTPPRGPAAQAEPAATAPSQPQEVSRRPEAAESVWSSAPDEPTWIPKATQTDAPRDDSEVPEAPTLPPRNAVSAKPSQQAPELNTTPVAANDTAQAESQQEPEPRTDQAEASDTAQAESEPQPEPHAHPVAADDTAQGADASAASAVPTLAESDEPTSTGQSDTSLKSVEIDESADPPWPDPTAASGYIWPGTTGRDMLRRLARGDAVRRDDLLSRRGDQDGSGRTDLVLFEIGDVCIKTSSRRRYQDVDEARIGMAHLARAKISLGALRPDPTVLALAVDGRGAWLWTVAPWLTTLRGALDVAVSAGDTERVGDVLDLYANAAIEALALTRSRGVLLDVHPSNFALQDERVVYIDDDVELGSRSLAAGHALLQRMAEYAAFPAALERYVDTLERQVLERLGWDGAQQVGLVDSLSSTIVSSVQARAAQGRLVEALTRPRPAIGSG